jgi:hypothetical protein
MKKIILCLFCLLLLLNAGCSSTKTSRYSPPVLKSRTSDSVLPFPNPGQPKTATAKNPSSRPTVINPTASQELITTSKYKCSDGKFLACEVQPLGSIRNILPTPPAMICGKCVDNKAQGIVRAVWCKNGSCKNNMNISDARQVYGKFVGEMSSGQFAGGSVVLITKIGTFYGSLTPDGGYNSGLLKKSKTGSVFIGKLNPDGGLAHGILAEKKANGKYILKLGDFINSKLEGLAYFYEDNAYTTMTCSAGDCKIYNRDTPKEQINSVLDIVMSELIENASLEKPIKSAVLAAVPTSYAINPVISAYDAWSNVQFSQSSAESL